MKVPARAPGSPPVPWLFVWTSDDDVTLVATRRVLQYPGPPARYQVHPAIAALVDQKAS
jgi:hypothetical protein